MGRGAKKRKKIGQCVSLSSSVGYITRHYIHCSSSRDSIQSSPIDLRRGFTAVGRRRIDMRRHQTLSLSLSLCVFLYTYTVAMGVEGKSAESREKGQKIIVWRCKRENEDSVSPRLALKSNQPINNQACVYYYYYYYYDNVCESERRVIPSSCAAAAAAAGTHRVFTLYKCGSCIF